MGKNWLCWAVILLAAEAAQAAPDPGQAAALELFEKRIRPTVVEHCYECHSGPARILRGGLRLDVADGWTKGGDSGPIILPDQPAESPLIEALLHDPNGLQMPPRARLPDAVIADFRRWIEAGAPLPEGFGQQAPQSGPNRNPATGVLAHTDYDEGRAFWSLVPPARVAVPNDPGAAWSANPIDRFVLARLKAAGLTPNGPADRRSLLRRVSFDLIGLPPSPAEIDQFLRDESPQAFEKVVDRLLASPHYGEHWARHWLDVARYGDTSGKGRDDVYRSAFRYRDYVISAFNTDKRYDQFILEQLAGDLLGGATIAERNERLIATTFLSLTPRFVAEQDKVQLQLDIVDEQIDVVGKAFLGLTLACARCHDHKFDPVSQSDYYALAGIFASTKVMESLEARLSQWHEQQLAAATPEEPAAFAMAAIEGEPVDLPVHIRGSVVNMAPHPTSRAVPRVTDNVLPPPDIPQAASGRLELARWIADERHPLTARVMINRVWAWHFGPGLVRSPSDFGYRGQAPTDPALLDWLAGEFVRQGWSVKQLHRLLLVSQTYLMSSDYSSQAAAVDPENRLHWRFDPGRLSAEQVRDSLLTAAAALDRTVGGTLLEVAKGKVEDFDIPADCFESRRRAVYLPIRRGELYPLFSAFDYLDASVSLDQRPVTVLPAQTLFMLNNPFVLEQAAGFAQRLLAGSADPAGRVDLAYQIAFGRPATDEERSTALDFIQASGPLAEAAAWADFCHLLFCSNEFLHLR